MSDWQISNTTRKKGKNHVKMLGLVHFPFISKRKQICILKFLVPLSLLVIFLLLAWSRLRLKSQQSLTKMQYDATSKINSTKLYSLRRNVITENRDEFLHVVLSEHKFQQIDLLSRSKHHREYYDDLIEADEKKVVPGLGENGEKAYVPKKYQALASRSMDNSSLKEVLNQFISVTRSVPDSREPACQKIFYDLATLPTLSIITILKNASYFSVIRMLHGIFRRTPAYLLVEVILVDDPSSSSILQGQLERYLATRFPPEKIRLVRLNKLAGVIRAKMIAAHLAVGDVLVFLDAHCEVNYQWAEPLLQRIKVNPTAVVCPIIDVIDGNTWEYQFRRDNYFSVGGFRFTGQFTWIPIPDREEKRKKFHHFLTKSPTMAGDMFAIDRKYFWKMGSFDPAMKVGGGENLEMSFRIWQCGGSIETHPCSRVGQLISARVNTDNFARVAEVWMDDFKELVLRNRYFKPENVGNVSLRQAFRRRKKCKSFQWYLDTVYPEKFKMERDSKYYGQVKNPESSYCLDFWGRRDSDNYTLSVYNCSTNYYSTQEHFYSTTGQLRREQSCAKPGSDETVKMFWCESLNFTEPSFHWDYIVKSKQLRNSETKKCLTLVKKEDGRANEEYDLVMKKCLKMAENQKWEFVPRNTSFRNKMTVSRR